MLSLGRLLRRSNQIQVQAVRPSVRLCSTDASDANNIFVGNLSWDTTRKDIIQAFSAFGTVARVRVMTDRETGRPRGFAFVLFEDADSAEKAIAGMNGKELSGRVLKVNLAKSRPATPRFDPASE